ncbi:hypothetical protein [Streptomyces sp. NPDC001205]
MTSNDIGTTEAPGGPWGSGRYKKRNNVECATCHLKGFRAVAARYESRAHIHLGTVALAILAICLRT